MSNYFNTLPLRVQLEELGKCRFMEPEEFRPDRDTSVTDDLSVVSSAVLLPHVEHVADPSSANLPTGHALQAACPRVAVPSGSMGAMPAT